MVNGALSLREAAVDHIRKRGFPGPIVADQSDTFSCADAQRRIPQGKNRPIGQMGLLQRDNRSGGGSGSRILVGLHALTGPTR